MPMSHCQSWAMSMSHCRSGAMSMSHRQSCAMSMSHCRSWAMSISHRQCGDLIVVKVFCYDCPSEKAFLEISPNFCSKDAGLYFMFFAKKICSRDWNHGQMHFFQADPVKQPPQEPPVQAQVGEQLRTVSTLLSRLKPREPVEQPCRKHSLHVGWRNIICKLSWFLRESSVSCYLLCYSCLCTTLFQRISDSRFTSIHNF